MQTEKTSARNGILAFVGQYNKIVLWLLIYLTMVLLLVRTFGWAEAFRNATATILPMLVCWAILNYLLLPRMLHRSKVGFFLLTLLMLLVLMPLGSRFDVYIHQHFSGPNDVPLPEAERIPLKFEAKDEAGDTYTIHWNTQNGDFHKLYLVDNITGVQYDMLRNSSYSFSGKKDDYWTRFYITFEVTGLEEEQDEDDDASTGSASTTFAFFDGSQWVVTNDGQGTATLDLIDLQGRVLHSTTLAEGQTSGGGAGEHMTSFDYAYKLEAVRDWLFAQSK